MTYDVEFKPRAIKDLKTLTLRDRERVVSKVEALQTDLAAISSA
jgi:mRNA interferase RelE/StbE